MCAHVPPCTIIVAAAIASAEPKHPASLIGRHRLTCHKTPCHAETAVEAEML